MTPICASLHPHILHLPSNHQFFPPLNLHPHPSSSLSKMSQQRTGPLTRLWVRWKSLDLPWRKRRLIGMDLTGTTYWELRATLSGRPRRIAQHPRQRDVADVSNMMSPAWHQWLRHTRATAPTLDEQHADLVRQSELKELARLADERWAAKPSFLDGPTYQQVKPGTIPGSGSGSGGGGRGEDVGEGNKEEMWVKGRKVGNPGDEWQPETWTPGGGARKG